MERRGGTPAIEPTGEFHAGGRVHTVTEKPMEAPR